MRRVLLILLLMSGAAVGKWEFKEPVQDSQGVLVSALYRDEVKTAAILCSTAPGRAPKLASISYFGEDYANAYTVNDVVALVNRIYYSWTGLVFFDPHIGSVDSAGFRDVWDKVIWECK